MRILRTHLSAASSDGFRGGSVFKAWNSQGVFHLPGKKSKEGRGKKNLMTAPGRRSGTFGGGGGGVSLFQGVRNERDHPLIHKVTTKCELDSLMFAFSHGPQFQVNGGVNRPQGCRKGRLLQNGCLLSLPARKVHLHGSLKMINLG